MADDTRQNDTSRTQGQRSNAYEGFHMRPENANLIPGGTTNTAGGQPKEFGIVDAAKTIKLQEFREIHKKPCVRHALLTGIGSGFALGGVTAIIGRPVASAANWAVGAFCTVSFGAYQYCLIRRQIEKDGMRRAVEIMDQKRAENQARLEAKRRAEAEAAKLAQQEEQRRENERRSQWWKIW